MDQRSGAGSQFPRAGQRSLVESACVNSWANSGTEETQSENEGDLTKKALYGFSFFSQILEMFEPKKWSDVGHESGSVKDRMRREQSTVLVVERTGKVPVPTPVQWQACTAVDQAVW